MPLDAKQRRALEQLAAGARQEDAAKVAGVSRETVSRWVNQDAEFAGELDALNREIGKGVARRIVGMHDDALDRLKKLVDSDDESIAMRAVAFVLEHGPLSKKSEQHAGLGDDRAVTADELAEAKDIAKRIKD